MKAISSRSDSKITKNTVFKSPLELLCFCLSMHFKFSGFSQKCCGKWNWGKSISSQECKHARHVSQTRSFTRHFVLSAFAACCKTAMDERKTSFFALRSLSPVPNCPYFAACAHSETKHGKTFNTIRRRQRALKKSLARLTFYQRLRASNAQSQKMKLARSLASSRLWTRL